MTTFIVIVLLVILVVYMIYIFRNINKANNLAVEAFINVDLTLKKRFELVSDLENIVKTYAENEKYIIERLEQISIILSEKMTVDNRAKQENKYSVIIRDIISVAENYPLLKTAKEFSDLQDSLIKIEEEIEVSRRYYNDMVRSYNALIKKFPNNILCAILDYNKGIFFDVDLLTRKKPEINFVDRRQRPRNNNS